MGHYTDFKKAFEQYQKGLITVENVARKASALQEYLCTCKNKEKQVSQLVLFATSNVGSRKCFGRGNAVTQHTYKHVTLKDLKKQRDAFLDYDQSDVIREVMDEFYENIIEDQQFFFNGNDVSTMKREVIRKWLSLIDIYSELIRIKLSYMNYDTKQFDEEGKRKLSNLSQRIEDAVRELVTALGIQTYEMPKYSMADVVADKFKILDIGL